MERVSINKTEYNLLNKFRGLPEDVYYMVVTAEEDGGSGYILEGKGEAFDNLAGYLSDEIYHELSPKSYMKTIQRLYGKVSPEVEIF